MRREDEADGAVPVPGWRPAAGWRPGPASPEGAGDRGLGTPHTTQRRGRAPIRNSCCVEVTVHVALTLVERRARISSAGRKRAIHMSVLRIPGKLARLLRFF